MNKEQMISNILKDLGVSVAHRGFGYLKCAIKLSLEKPSMLNMVTKELYPEVASLNDTTSQRVERAIRHSIEKAWLIGNLDVINTIFGNSVDANRGKPTNSQFIATITEYLSTVQED